MLIGLIPANNDFEPTVDGVEVMVTSTAHHADLVLPLRNETTDWSRHPPAGDVGRATRVAFGWGDKKFHVDNSAR
jgi:hypothetical protein